MRELSVAVLGAAGTIGPAIVHDLALSEEVKRLVLLDLDPAAAQAVADAHGAEKASARAIDARDGDSFAAALGGVDVLVNSASYRINLQAMHACLAAGCHYLDLGGLYWMTLKQLELGPQFERAERLALLGIGSSPGKTNLMALQGVRQLGGDDVETIDVTAGGRDLGAPQDGRLRPPYALQTLIDELTLSPVVLRDHRPVEIAALTDGGSVDFGEPIGPGETIFTLHSELVTFGESFGCAQASFRLSLAPALLERLKALVGSAEEEIQNAAREAVPPSGETVSVHIVRLATATGRELSVRAITRPWSGIGGSIVSTATPASSAVRLLARGRVTAVGALPPERCIDPEEMFAELAERGCEVSVYGPEGRSTCPG
jgi:saccharopine dehydrogenase (NAD+, L-lysine-forming)